VLLALRARYLFHLDVILAEEGDFGGRFHEILLHLLGRIRELLDLRATVPELPTVVISPAENLTCLFGNSAYVVETAVDLKNRYVFKGLDGPDHV